MSAPNSPAPQEALTNFMTDPENIKKAVEGSMAKRAAVLYPEEALKDSNILDQVIRSAGMAAHIYSKISFDNAKDTQQLIAAANENGQLLIDAVLARAYPRIEEMMVERLSGHLEKSDVFMKVGDKIYEIQEAQ